MGARQTSGRVILISGSVLTVCYAVGLFFPGWLAVNVGAMLAIMSNVLSALIILPMILAAAPGFFKVPEARESRFSALWEAHAARVTSPRGRLIIPTVVLSI